MPRNRRFRASRGPWAAPLLMAVSLAAACGAAPSGEREGDPPMTSTSAEQTAVLAGGCFWCIEAVFDRIEGVTGVRSGYSGGTVPNPTYEQVSTGTTGHAEAVEVRFDPAKISYREILEIFFAMHDPTTRDRQGADVGPQYRSAIFFADDRQRETAGRVVRELTEAGVFDAPIVTEIVPLEKFWEAEAYHQDYYDRNTQQGYCRLVISPKLSKLRQKFAHRLREPSR